MKFIRSILLILNILLAVGLLLSTLAGSVSPSRFMPLSLAAYLYLPLLGANLLMVVVWLLMGRWEFLLSVAVIALWWSMVGMYFQVGGTSKVPDREEHPMMVYHNIPRKRKGHAVPGVAFVALHAVVAARLS